MIADRIQQIDSSGIRKVFDLAKNLKNPVNLSIGQPHFDIPDPIKKTGKEWIDKGFNQYTQTQGSADLREAIFMHLRKDKNWEPEDLLITSGVSGGIFLSFLSLLNPGDEIILADPYFVMYKHLTNLLGAKPVYIDTYPDFKITAEKIEPKITKKTKCIILNSPSNPTGIMLDHSELKDIGELATIKGIPIISDEIYEDFSYDAPTPSITQYCDQSLLLSGFSKSFAMTGWRIGYAAGPKSIIQAMTKLQQFTFVCAPSIAQKMALQALQTDIHELIDEYRQKRDLIYQGIKDQYDVVKPQGAFYIFPKAPGENAEKFVAKAIEKNLLIIPGNVFSERNTHLRISFAASNDTIKKGIEILNSLV